MTWTPCTTTRTAWTTRTTDTARPVSGPGGPGLPAPADTSREQHLGRERLAGAPVSRYCHRPVAVRALSGRRHRRRLTMRGTQLKPKGAGIEAGFVASSVRFREAVVNGLPLGRIGPLEVRLTRSAAEVTTVQQVRCRVCYGELGARGDIASLTERRDADRCDDVCDHLLVLDKSLPGSDLDRVVGTYRLLRGEMATAAGGFYSNDE